MNRTDNACEPAATSAHPAAQAAEGARWKRTARLLITLVAVTWVALIGLYSIEELNSRQETLRVLIAEETRASAEAAVARKDEKQANAAVKELNALRLLHQRLVALSVSGAVREPGGYETLRNIQCDLVQLRGSKVACERAGAGAYGQNEWEAGWLFLAPVSGTTSSGLVLALTILTAAFGGALITSSLPQETPGKEPREHPLLTMLRAVGGGVVCYLAVNGGEVPLTATDLSKATSPAIATLYGLLAGMFSEEVFKFLASVVRAFFKRIAPSEGDPKDPTPARS